MPFHPSKGKAGTQQVLKYDIEAILKTISEASKFTKSMGLHGGEATVVPIADAERIFEKIKEVGARATIQTNGFLINDKWIELFKKYDVFVGVSLDGEGELNAARGFFDSSGQRLDVTSNAYTEKVMDNLRRMKEAGIGVGIICVLNRFNALRPQREKLHYWLNKLKNMGITVGRLNLVYVDDEVLRPMLELTPEEAADVWVDLADFVLSDKDLKWAPFREMEDNLLGLGLASCHFTGCDSEHTEGEIVIAPDGSIQNCSRIHKDGQPTARRDGLGGTSKYDRTLRLRSIPMEKGGCGGCRYWSVCFGGCPAESNTVKNETTAGKDFSGKTRACLAIKSTYAFIEGRMKEVFPNLKTVPDMVANMAPRQIVESIRERGGGDLGDAFEKMSTVRTERASVWQGVEEGRKIPYEIEGWSYADIGYDRERKKWFVNVLDVNGKQLAVFVASKVELSVNGEQISWEDSKGGGWHVRERIYRKDVSRIVQKGDSVKIVGVVKKQAVIPENWEHLEYMYSRETGKANVRFFGGGKMLGQINDVKVIAERVRRRTEEDNSDVRYGVDRKDVKDLIVTESVALILGW
jgi:uncharacterized protein